MPKTPKILQMTDPQRLALRKLYSAARFLILTAQKSSEEDIRAPVTVEGLKFATLESALKEVQEAYQEARRG